MGKIVIKNGYKWDYDSHLNKYTLIEKVIEEPKKKKTAIKKEVDE